MAEVAGLALGVVGVAGVIGAFKDAIDLLDMIRTAKHLDRDYAILDIKLDIERALLLQWATRVRLLRPDYDRRLDDPTTRDLVHRSLGCIQQFLSDSTDLKTKYGLAEEPGPSPAVGGQVSRIGDNRMTSFVQDFNGLRLASQNRDGILGKWKTRVRWIVKDKQQFSGFVEQLDYFVGKLNQIIIPVDNSKTQESTMTQEDLNDIHDASQLQRVIEASAGLHDEIAESAKRKLMIMTSEDRILGKLWFRRINDRRESVRPAHAKTFCWSLEPPQQGRTRWSNLPGWLEHGNGIYWMSGKAGSGKSTLMKYISGESKTRWLLSQWSSDSPLHMYDFFFTQLGTVEQKTTDGFCRGLLYQILSDHRSLIPEALPDMWKETYDSLPEADSDIPLPSSAETERAFRAIASTTSDLGKLFIFVDGLDELEGEIDQVLAILNTLCGSGRVKAIVSSRPIPDCVAAFDKAPRLRLHDLTYTDISTYVEDTLGKHEYILKLERRFPEEISGIKHTVVEKASGVFLWVILACASVLRGCANYDRVHELQRYVDDLPPELEQLFEHMLRKVPRPYRDQGARLLRICHTYYKSTERDSDILYTLGLALTDDHHLQPIDLDTIENADKISLCEELEGRLRSRCGGLVEVVPGTGDGFCFCSPREKAHQGYDVEKTYVIDSQVRFMHRTVLEFLNDDEVWEFDCLRVTRGGGFCEAAALSVYNLTLAAQSVDPLRRDQVNIYLDQAMFWASRTGQKTKIPLLSCYESIQPLISRLPSSWPVDDGEKGGLARELQRIDFYHSLSIPRAPQAFLAVLFNDWHYLRQYPHLQALLSHDRRTCHCRSLLGAAVDRTVYPVAMVWLLLSAGADPNESIQANLAHQDVEDFREAGSHLSTPWKIFMRQYESRGNRYISAGLAFDVIDGFCKAGVDPQMAEMFMRKCSKKRQNPLRPLPRASAGKATWETYTEDVIMY